MLIPQAIVQTGGAGSTEYAYVEFTANVTISSTTEASPDEIVSAGAVSFDGATRVCIEIYFPSIRSSGSASEAVIDLWEGTNELGHMGNPVMAASADGQTLMARRFLTPTAGSKTYKVRGWKAGANCTISAGVGGSSGVYLPGYIRITSA